MDTQANDTTKVFPSEPLLAQVMTRHTQVKHTHTHTNTHKIEILCCRQGDALLNHS